MAMSEKENKIPNVFLKLAYSELLLSFSTEELVPLVQSSNISSRKLIENAWRDDELISASDNALILSGFSNWLLSKGRNLDAFADSMFGKLNHLNSVPKRAILRSYLPYIRDFLEANDDLSIKIKEIKGEEESTVRVAAYASIAMRWMPEVLYRYKRVCPGVDVDLRMVDNTLEPFELLIEGKTDVIFASRQDYDNISWTPLYDETMYAIVPEAYPDREYFDIADFKDKDFLMPYGRFDIDVYRILGDIKINEICNQVDDETLIRMVSKGLGITMMSEMMIRGSLKGVKCIPIKPEAKRQLGMGTRFKNNSRIIEELKNCVIYYLHEG